MKGKFIKIIALFSALILVFSLIGCDEKNDGETTTDGTKANTEVVASDENNTDSSETEAVTDEKGNTVTDKNKDKTKKNDSDNKTTKNGTKTTKKNDKTTAATTKKNTNGAPVDGSIAEIVKFYNTAANATKAEQNFAYTRKEITKVYIDDISTQSGSLEWLTKIANEIIDSLVGKGDVVKQTFVYGKSDKVYLNGKEVTKKQDLEGLKFPKNDCMPIMGSEKMSTLTEKGVKSATCKKDGDGYIVTIVLNPEVGTIKKKPPVHASCVNYLRLEALDLGIFNDCIESAEMHYIDDTNSGTKFVARINKNNRLDYMNTYMTINGNGSGTLPGITATAKLHGTYESEYKFIW